MPRNNSTNLKKLQKYLEYKISRIHKGNTLKLEPSQDEKAAFFISLNLTNSDQCHAMIKLGEEMLEWFPHMHNGKRSLHCDYAIAMRDGNKENIDPTRINVILEKYPEDILYELTQTDLAGLRASGCIPEHMPKPKKAPSRSSPP